MLILLLPGLRNSGSSRAVLLRLHLYTAQVLGIHRAVADAFLIIWGDKHEFLPFPQWQAVGIFSRYIKQDVVNQVSPQQSWN